ncbi:MAG: type II toxin-antitoxin system RelE/ParE family toxin [Deltaproteobacteria bacterium]|nr:type II toxin-antitoxin system RelE/ParE family toxin [Deltaproteobacteria bacterium]
MDTFNVQATRSAIDDLQGIPNRFREQIITSIKPLYTTPLLSGTWIKKLKGFKPPLYRLRSRDYRILYRIEGRNIIIMRVIDRKELEKIIKRLHL